MHGLVHRHLTAKVTIVWGSLKNKRAVFCVFLAGGLRYRHGWQLRKW